MTARGEGCAEIRLPAEVSTKRLTLRRWKRADIPLLQGAIETNLDHLRPWMAWIAAEPLGDNDREALIETWDADWTCGGDVVYGVFAGDVIVGGTGLHRRRGPSVLEIGYWIHVDHTRRGYASEIAATLTSTAFGVDGIERVEIHHDKANTLSRRIPDALGYHLVGEEPDEPEAPGEVGIDCAWSMSKHVWLARTTVDTDNRQATRHCDLDGGNSSGMTSSVHHPTVPFPDELPPEFEWFTDEPVFDPDRHLALEQPTDVIALRDLGYAADEITTKATSIAASSPFRVLSDEGADLMLATARRLRSFVKPAGNRIERTVRGGCYRSRWMRDFCLSDDVTRHLAAIYGTDIAPHPMPHHLGHLNYEPSSVDTAVDKWHHDTLPLDYVLAVTDPNLTPGGRFEYFLGTKGEAAEFAARGERPPADRIVAPEFGGPGYAIALHGDMVVHRGGPLTAEAERITMVNGYVALDPNSDDQSRSADLIGVDDPRCLYAEWAKFAAWRSRGRLDRLIAELEFTDDVDAVTAELEASVADVERAVAEMRAGARPAAHYEG